MQKFNRARALRWARQSRAEQVGPLTLRPPIEPRASDVKTSEDHPLWQFFDAQKRYMRPHKEFEDIGSAWTIPQLRRKNFNDLHALWYVCLKESNRVSRELRVLAAHQNRPGEDTTRFKKTDNAATKTAHEIDTTMWRIRHVLAERYHGFQSLKTFELESEYAKALETFKEEYLSADSNADGEVNAKLERFQFAFFGLNPLLETNFPEPRVVRGLYTVAQLKLSRYASDQSSVTDVRDIREAFTLFGAEPSPEGLAEAIQTILEVRSAGEPVPRDQDVEVLAELMNSSK